MKIRMNAGAAVTLLALAALHASALGADKPAKVQDMPAVLKGIPRATGVCRPETVSVGDLGGVPTAKPDFGCAIPVSAMPAAMQRPETVLIDVRPAAEYGAFHIEGALMASLADLRNKPYWRSKNVILVGTGKAETELYSACAALKQTYKHVQVLRGGMPAWLAAQGPVLGRAPSAQHIVRLSPAEFWLETQQADNLVVLDKQQAALQSDVAFSMVLPDTSAAAIKTVMGQRSRGLKTKDLSSVVLVAGAGFSDQQVASLQNALAPVPLLVYSDSRDAFRAQVKLQKAIWLARTNGPKQLGCGL